MEAAVGRGSRVVVIVTDGPPGDSISLRRFLEGRSDVQLLVVALGRSAHPAHALPSDGPAAVEELGALVDLAAQLGVRVVAVKPETGIDDVRSSELAGALTGVAR